MHDEKQVLVKSGINAVLKACRDNTISGGHFGHDKPTRKLQQDYIGKVFTSYYVIN